MDVTSGKSGNPSRILHFPARYFSIQSISTFIAYLKNTEGSITVPNDSLNGRQSKIVVTDYKFGRHTILYSTAEVLTYGVWDVNV